MYYIEGATLDSEGLSGHAHWPDRAFKFERPFRTQILRIRGMRNSRDSDSGELALRPT